MRRLTVVQLLPALESGGVERSTLEIAQALVDAGHRAIVVSKGGRLVPRLLALGADIWVAPFVMAAINTRNVHRSNFLLRHAYGTDFVYDEMLVTGPGEVAVEVNPFGTDSYGIALVTLTTAEGSDRMVCVYDKARAAAELSAPFPPPDTASAAPAAPN